MYRDERHVVFEYQAVAMRIVRRNTRKTQSSQYNDRNILEQPSTPTDRKHKQTQSPRPFPENLHIRKLSSSLSHPERDPI